MKAALIPTTDLSYAKKRYFEKKKCKNRLKNRIARRSRQINRLIKKKKNKNRPNL